MEINTKYEMGQKVYRARVIKRTFDIEETCDLCCGEKKINYKGYKNGFNRNDGDIQSYISKIESLIIEKTIYKVPSAIDEKGRVISESVLPKERNKIVDSIADELNNRYYIIMYGKRTYKKENAKQNK